MAYFESLYWMCYNVDSVFYVLVFDHEAYEILAPQPGIETTPLSLESEDNYWTTREVPSPLITVTKVGGFQTL